MRHGRRLQYAFDLSGQMPRSVLQFFQGGVKARRQRAGWDEASLLNVLFHAEARALVSSRGFIICGRMVDSHGRSMPSGEERRP